MKTVYIYLRAVQQDKKWKLSLFDSNRDAGIDDLVTDVPPGGKVIWVPDCNSGIKDITKIVSKTGERNVFKTDPVKRTFCKGFSLYIDNSAKGQEAYSIEYVLNNGEKILVDPYIRVKPPEG